jgi:hypothetical protein
VSNGLSNKALSGIMERETGKIRALIRPVLDYVTSDHPVPPGLDADRIFTAVHGVAVYETAHLLRALLQGRAHSKLALRALHQASTEETEGVLPLHTVLAFAARIMGEEERVGAPPAPAAPAAPPDRQLAPRRAVRRLPPRR